jgi:hypothetical protein
MWKEWPNSSHTTTKEQEVPSRMEDEQISPREAVVFHHIIFLSGEFSFPGRQTLDTW